MTCIHPTTCYYIKRKPSIDCSHGLIQSWIQSSYLEAKAFSAFLEMIRRASPDLYDRFGALEPDIGTDNEQDRARSLYSHLPDINFSRHILAARPRDLAVLPVTGLRWRDLGKPRRVLSTLADIGVKPAQAHAWNSASRLEATLA